MNSIAGLPRIVIEVDGRRLADGWMPSLTGVQVRQRLSLPAQAELVLAVDSSAPLTGLDAAPGAELKIAVGDGQRLFDGQVTAVEYDYGPAQQRVLRVRAYDALHRLRKRQAVKSHTKLDLARLAAALVGPLGLRVSSGPSSPKCPRRVQFRQSDFQLLTEAAEACGQYFTLRDQTLHLLTLKGLGSPVGLTLGEGLLEARVELNAELTCRSVKTAGWDTSRVELHRGHAGQARVGRRVGAQVSARRAGSSGERWLSDKSFADDHQADALAQAELDRCVASEVTLWGVAEGDPQLRPGSLVDIAGVDAPAAGRYVLTAVTHRIDDREGFVSEISSAPPAPTEKPRGAATSWGVVTRIDDPQGWGRVRVRLPTYNDVETDWMGVVTPGGGPGKGLVVMPSAGDNVLVLFANGDPAQGMVIGGLFGTEPPPDDGVDGNSVHRYTFATPGGQRLQLDDAAKSLRLDNSDGSYVELTPRRTRVHSNADLILEAPGKSVFVRGKAIRFEEK